MMYPVHAKFQSCHCLPLLTSSTPGAPEADGADAGPQRLVPVRLAWGRGRAGGRHGHLPPRDQAAPLPAPHQPPGLAARPRPRPRLQPRPGPGGRGDQQAPALGARGGAQEEAVRQGQGAAAGEAQLQQEEGQGERRNLGQERGSGENGIICSVCANNDHYVVCAVDIFEDKTKELEDEVLQG